MAKRTKIEAPAVTIATIEDCDVALKELAVIKANIDNEESAYNAKEQAERAILTSKLIPERERISDIERALQTFGELNRHLFEKKRTIELKHGSVGFRTHPPKVTTIAKMTFKAVVELIKGSKFAQKLISVKYDLNKEAVIASQADSSIEAVELRQLGLEIVQAETFGYDLKYAVEGTK
jgi:phage host-nuclease inhibitor protein Gam